MTVFSLTFENLILVDFVTLTEQDLISTLNGVTLTYNSVV